MQVPPQNSPHQQRTLPQQPTKMVNLLSNSVSCEEKSTIYRGIVAIARQEKAVFLSLIGELKTCVNFKRVSSVCREADCPPLKARILEIHQFKMNPVSILLILPNNQATGLGDIDTIHLWTIPNLVNGLEKKRINALLPSDLFRVLKKAEALPAQEIALSQAKHSPLGQEFQVIGSYMVVLYNHTSGCPLQVCSVINKSENITKSMLQLIQKYGRIDKKYAGKRGEESHIR